MQSYEKSRAEQNKYVCFLCRDGVTYPRLRLSERKCKSAVPKFDTADIYFSLGIVYRLVIGYFTIILRAVPLLRRIMFIPF